MTFKDSVALSNECFFDVDVFANVEQIEYRSIMCVLDTEVHGRDTNHEEGKKNIRIFIKDEEVMKNSDCLPKMEGDSINVSGSEYIVESWSVEQGVHVVYAYRYGE